MRTSIKSTYDEQTLEQNIVCHYSYTYVKDPDPWVATQARLASVPTLFYDPTHNI